MSVPWHSPVAHRASMIAICAAVAVLLPACTPADADLSLTSGRPTKSGPPSVSATSTGTAKSTSAANPTTTTEPTPTATDDPSPSTTPDAPPSDDPVADPPSESTEPTTTPPPNTPPSSTPDAPTASGATNAGLPAGVNLRPSGGMTAGTAGQILENLDVTGTIEITARNVTIRNSRLTGTGQGYGVLVQPGASVTIDHVQIRGDYQTAGFRGANLTITNSEITGMSSDAGKIENNNVVAGNLIHNFAPGSGAHADGLQMETPAGNVQIRGNTILMPGQGSPELQNVTGALFIVPQLTGSYGGPSAGPVVVVDNTLGGGTYTAHFDSAQFPLKDLRVTGNTFMDDSAFGAVYPSGYRPASWTGNVTESGQPVAPPE